ncbi:hypothetical protein ACKWTF_012660 [Chironomus riparius]
MIAFGSAMSAPITAITVQTTASELAKNVITNNLENDVTIIMNALNSTSLAGCVPQISYPNDLNISTSCFSTSCLNTEVQCQALYLQVAIDELTIALNTATYNLNLTSSTLVGTSWDFPSLANITTQWSIVKANIEIYQSSTKAGPLIIGVNSRFKTALRVALERISLFLNNFENGYKALIIAVNNTNYAQSLENNANINVLSATSTAENKLLTESFSFSGIIVASSSVQSSISGISVTSFVRPLTIAVLIA